MKLLISRNPVGIIREIGLSIYAKHFGFLLTPAVGGVPHIAIQSGAVWAADNSAFSGFEAGRYLAMLKRIEGLPGCKFVVAPDVVADAKATLRFFAQWEPVVRDFGLPVAFVAQDGQEACYTPYDRFEALFVGGTTQWKLSEQAASIIREAKRRGKWVHMGRVNSNRRIQYAKAMGVDSVDGSGYARFSKDMVPRSVPALKAHTLPLWEGLCGD